MNENGISKEAGKTSDNWFEFGSLYTIFHLLKFLLVGGWWARFLCFALTCRLWICNSLLFISQIRMYYQMEVGRHANTSAGMLYIFEQSNLFYTDRFDYEHPCHIDYIWIVQLHKAHCLYVTIIKCSLYIRQMPIRKFAPYKL